MTKTLEQLLKQVSPDASSKELNQTFLKLAKTLMRNYEIAKGKNKSYDIMSIEFYYCSKNHFDLTVYPREGDYGKWFFHSSGMDLTFKSDITTSGNKIDYNKDFGYGGILIRKIKPNKEGTTHDIQSDEGSIDGPLKVEWELFDKFNALNAEENKELVPILIKRDNPLDKKIVCVKRKNITLTRFENQLPKILHERFLSIENEEELIKQARANIDDEKNEKTWLGYEIEKVKSRRI
nr:hypothetical protein [uncultured Prevotella sp.]